MRAAYVCAYVVPLCMFVCLSVFLSVCLPGCLPACLAGWLAGWLSVCLSVCMYVCMYVCILPDRNLPDGKGGSRFNQPGPKVEGPKSCLNTPPKTIRQTPHRQRITFTFTPCTCASTAAARGRVQIKWKLAFNPHQRIPCTAFPKFLYHGIANTICITPKALGAETIQEKYWC